MPRRAKQLHIADDGPKAPTPRLFRVVGAFPVGEIKPGGLVRLALPDVNIRHLIDAGHVELVEPTPFGKPDPTETEPANSAETEEE